MGAMIRSMLFFFFNDTATTEIYTLSLHDALPILHDDVYSIVAKYQAEYVGIVEYYRLAYNLATALPRLGWIMETSRSEEHTSELQSRQYLVCRLLLEKKKNKPHDPLDDACRLYIT